MVNFTGISTEKLIAKKEEQKEGLMQKLLTGKRRFKEFVKDDWNEVDLGTIANIRRGASPRPISDPKYFSNNGRGWIRISDLTAEEGMYITKASQYLSKEGENCSVKVNDGDFIMSICATMGLPKIVKFPACIHDGFVLISEFQKKLDKNSLYHFINFITPKLAGSGQPGTQKNLNTDIVSKIILPLPSLKEQKRIAVVLTNAEDEIQHIKSHLRSLREKKKGLMQVLLTGKKRVKI